MTSKATTLISPRMRCVLMSVLGAVGLGLAQAQAPVPAQVPKAPPSSSAASFQDCATCPPVVSVPSGSFQMGSDDGPDENPIRRVRLASFAIGRTEVTQGQWRAVMGADSRPSQSTVCTQPNCPVDSVSLVDIATFLTRLSSKTGKIYRLPTEAEWEYACRAGSVADPYCGGADLQRLAWYARNGGGHAHPVAQKQPNAWGVFDMSGNVWEWVSDCYHPDYIGAPKDGRPWIEDACPFRIDRGGSFESEDEALRTTNRSSIRPDLRDLRLGFRVVRALP